MFIKLPKVVIGNNLTAMVTAANLGAFFIPVDYHQPFAWEFLDFKLKQIYFLRSCYRSKKRDDHLMYRYKSENFTWDPPCFLWELEQYMKFFLGITSLLYDDFKNHHCYLSSIEGVNILNVHSLNGGTLTIQFGECWIANPDSKFFTNLINNPIENIQSEQCHILYHMKLNTEKYYDMKGMVVEYDMEDIKGQLFNKKWNALPFGPKILMKSWDKIKKKQTVSTHDAVFICENVDQELIDTHDYNISNMRLQIYAYMSQFSKRIKERIMNYEYFLNKMVLSTNLDIYTDLDNVKFIYPDKEEVLCQNNLEKHFMSGSYRRIHFRTTKQAFGRALFGLPVDKRMF